MYSLKSLRKYILPSEIVGSHAAVTYKEETSNLIRENSVREPPFIKQLRTQFVCYSLCIQEYKIDTDEEGKLKQFNISWGVLGGTSW
jgi:hypothetical protein